MSQPDLEAALRDGFPDAEIEITDLAGDGDHYKARIVSAAFAGLMRRLGALDPKVMRP